MPRNLYSPQNLVLNGSLENDLLLGTARKEWLFGSDGDDIVFADAADDILYGGSGHDFLLGWTGDDLLVGQSGDDILVGGVGNDILSGESGVDTLIGGLGSDQFALIKSSPSTDLIADFSSLQGDKVTVFALSFGVTSLSEIAYDSSSGGLFFEDTQIASLQAGLHFVPHLDVVLV